MRFYTTYSVQISRFAQILTRGLTQNVFPMESFSKHRIELAKQKLREKLTFQYVSKLPAYKGITKKQYDKLIGHIETISLVLLETIINSNQLPNG